MGFEAAFHPGFGIYDFIGRNIEFYLFECVFLELIKNKRIGVFSE